MLRLEKVNAKNVWDILKLQVLENQKSFVASNNISIIEAYTTITGNGHAFPFGIYDDDTPVGFLMIGYGLVDEDDVEDENPGFIEIVKNGYCIWRFMIDKRYQGRGYGKRAMELALEYIRTFPCGKADYCWLSYEPENEVAKKLYASFGFIEEPKYYKEGEEMPAILKL